MPGKGKGRDTTSGGGARRWNPVTTHEERVAGAELMRLLLTWYASCKLTAQQFCVACHFCQLSGVKGASFEMYSVEPGKGSGFYQKTSTQSFHVLGPCMKCVLQ